METVINNDLQFAFDFVKYTNRNIFLTGRAGTGKTTYLHNLKKISPKRMIVVAPTGVAAINAGGVTLRSFFQLPFHPYVPSFYLPQNNHGNPTEQKGPAGYKMSREKMIFSSTIFFTSKPCFPASNKLKASISASSSFSLF
jgi:hypothetical protein